MKLTTTLKGQDFENQIREVGINPNYWYAVARSWEVKIGGVLRVTLWEEAIALYRNSEGKVCGLENACPHKGVELDKGEVCGENLVCPYHGWQFNGEGKCVNIPYFPPEQKLPPAKVRTYPVREKYGLIWVFPGDANLAEEKDLPNIKEYDDAEWFGVPIPARFQAHFSICNENAMDVFHGYLHKNLQGWFDPVLTNLTQTETAVNADYQISYKNRPWSNFLGVSDRSQKVTTKTLSVRYDYPHFYSRLEGLSSLYLMRLPVSPTETRSFSILFLKLGLPKWLLKPFKWVLAKAILHLLFYRFLGQDVEMVESEQRNYLANPQRQYVEVNPAIIALQKIIIKQGDRLIVEPQKNDP